MQHWFVLTKDIQTHVYVIVMLLTEFVWEWEVIFNVGQYPCHSWNIKLIACTMLVAHWLHPGVVVTTLRMQLQPVFRCSPLSTLDPGSGR